MTIYDPKVEEAQIWQDLQEACPSTPLENIKKHVTIVHSALEACKQKEAIVIATEWKEFRDIDWQTVYNDMSKPAFVFDGRMILDAAKLKEIGFTVSSKHFDYTYLSVSLYAWSIGSQIFSHRSRRLAAATVSETTRHELRFARTRHGRLEAEIQGTDD